MTLVLVALALGARANLAIYNFTATMNVTADGVDATLRISGVLIVDVDDGRAIRIGRYRLNGARRLIDGTETLRVWRAQGASGTRTLAVTRETDDSGESYRETTMHYSGKDSSLNLGPITVPMPKSIKGGGYTVVDHGGPLASGFSTQTASHTYSSKATQQANWAGQSLETIAWNYRNTYLLQGYNP